MAANVDHLGPFRPTLWAHWEVFANTLDANPVAWRAMRLAWCGFAATALLWLLRELGLAPAAALVAAAAAVWNPYRNEIWTSLTLSEGVAMPYALAALAAARRAAGSPRSLRWDLLSAACVLTCLGCKNTFVAVVPAQLALRLLPDGLTARDGWRQGKWAVPLYLAPLLLPAAHFVYFKLHWHPGQYETPGPSLAQAGRFASWMKGAMGLDFLGAGVALVVGALALGESPRTIVRGLGVRYRAALIGGALLLLAGAAVYLPVPMVAARYTMPAVWGTDILFAVLLTAFVALPLSWPKRVAWAGVAAGMAVLAVANVGRQERVMARSRVLWDAVHVVERTAPPGARVAWACGTGDSAAGRLNAEEGIHFRWHLLHRGRGDVKIQLLDADTGGPVPRVELPAPDGPPDFRLVGGPGADDPPGWDAVRTFSERYRLGTRQYTCRLSERPRLPEPRAGGGGVLILDPTTAAVMMAGFADPAADVPTLVRRATGEGRRP